jgi:ribosomal protein S24E
MSVITFTWPIEDVHKRVDSQSRDRKSILVFRILILASHFLFSGQQFKMSKADNATVRTRKFMKNHLLKRRQMVVDVIHPGRANVPKTELATKLGAIYKKDPANVVLFGFKTAFGGGKSTGFCLIYDDQSSLKEFEPKYRLIRVCCFLQYCDLLILTFRPV